MSKRPENAFLLGLGAESYRQLSFQLTPVDLVLGTYLQRDSAPTEWVYFPEGSLLSFISTDSAGQGVETLMAGSEGAAGILEACGSGYSAVDCVVQVDGRAWRTPASLVRNLAASDPSFSARVWRLIELQFAEMQQSALCLAMHDVEQRFARWLIESLERSGGRNPLPMTQDFLAAMLGVQRTTVSSFASEFQRRGVINYRRGKLEIVDPLKLAALACECHMVSEADRRRLHLSAVRPEPEAAPRPVTRDVDG